MRPPLLTAIVALTVALAACANRPTSAVLPAHTAQAPPIASTPQTLQPRPAPREAVSPDPNFDYGFVVQITSQGFHPKWLLTGCCLAVTWKNLTGQPVSVVFDHQLVKSGLIPPGSSWVWKPDTIQSVTYHSGVDPLMTGAVQVQQTFES